MKENKYKLDKKRVELLLREQNIQKKEIAILWNVKPQQISQYLNNKIDLEKLVILAKKLNVSTNYLIGKSNHKNFSDALENYENRIQLQEITLYNLLESYGYIIGETVFYEKNHKYYKKNELEIKPWDKFDYDEIIEVFTPTKEIEYISKNRLDTLTNDFMTLFKNSFMQTDNDIYNNFNKELELG